MVASSTKTGYGRLPKVTNGRFVAAKLEKPALCIGQLWRSPKVGYGSASDSQVSELAARQLTAMPGSQTAAAHGCRHPARRSRSRPTAAGQDLLPDRSRSSGPTARSPRAKAGPGGNQRQGEGQAEHRVEDGVGP